MTTNDEFDFRPKAQSEAELQERLLDHLTTGVPCEVLYEHAGEIYDVECFVASVHHDYVLLGRIFSASCSTAGVLYDENR